MYVVNPRGISGGNPSQVTIGGGLDPVEFLDIVYKVGSIFITDVLGGYPGIGRWELLDEEATIVGADDSHADFCCGHIGGSDEKPLGGHDHKIAPHGHTGPQCGTSNGWYTTLTGSGEGNYTSAGAAGTYHTIVNETTAEAGDVVSSNIQPSRTSYFYRRCA